MKILLSHCPSRRHFLQSLQGLAVAGSLGLAACERSSEKWPSVGDEFPAFSLSDLNGKFIDSNGYSSKAMLVNFWATWCPPCSKEMADLERLHRALSPKGLRLLAISVDDDANLVREFVRRQDLSFQILLDPGQRWLRTALKIAGFPTSFMVDARHIIRDVAVGPREWAQDSVQETIASKLELV
jgi:peroxiredoxin